MLLHPKIIFVRRRVDRAGGSKPNSPIATPTLRDAQAPGQDVSQAEPEAMLPRHRVPRDLMNPKQNHDRTSSLPGVPH